MGYRYRPDFLCPEHADMLYATLLDTVAWQHESLHLYGRRVQVPRLVSWCGDRGLNYRYSGRDHVCTGWWPALETVRRRVADETGLPFNFVLINRYPDGQAYMGWHADDERGMASTVASLSLGATRRFLVRLPGEQRSRALDLEHASLLLLDGGIRHSLPKTRQVVGERVNLTFRHLISP